MSDISAKVLAQAMNEVMSKGVEHGDADASFLVVGEYWGTYLRSIGINAPNLASHDVAQMLSLLKKTRATIGNVHQPDHYVDDAGYVGLAAKLAGVKLP